jgi:hypothetical protein
VIHRRLDALCLCVCVKEGHDERTEN